MFSVGASPFNSPSRQIYGGWTLDDATRANNLWAKKEFYRMTSKYSRNEADRKAANRWLKMYRAAIHADRGLSKRVRRQGMPFWDKAIYPPMTDAQKQAIYQAFLGQPLSDDQGHQILSRLIRKSPYPNYTIMARNPDLAVPWVQGTQNLPYVPGRWRTLDDLKAAFKAMAGRGNRSYTAADVANEFNVDQGAVQAYLDGLRAAKDEGLLH